jgi:two-component system, response regulator YesN
VKMFDIIAHQLISAEVVSIHDLETVEKIRKIIHDRFKESISTSYIAKQVCMSESYVSYLFKKETGDTITEYIEKTRLKKAKELLDLTSLSVKEISSEIGYQDQNYFSRMFKKHEGISPTRYRCETRL